MKTYLKEIRVPRLEIKHDTDAESPRANDNIGLFFTKEDRHKSPDGNTHPLYELMIETQADAKNTEDHIRLMKVNAGVMFKESAPKDGNSHNEELHIIDIYPVYRYEHSGVAYKRGKAGGFDYSNCGFYIVTAESASGGTYTDKDITRLIDAELAEYTQWVNGEVYRFKLYNEDGILEDCCTGFYDIEDIREHLPEDWKDEKLEEYME